MLEVQQALTITLPPLTRGYKRSILCLSQLAGSTEDPYHHPTTHKTVQEEYPLPFPTCWKYNRPLSSPYHPQEEGTRAVSSSYPPLLEVQQALTITLLPATRAYKRNILFTFPHMLEVQQALTITLPPTTRGYKKSVLFLSPLAGSTEGPYHHPSTHNKRVQEEYPLPFPTCWKYSRPFPSLYHPQQEGTRGVSSSFPHLLEVQQALSSPYHPQQEYKRSFLFLSPLAGRTAGPYHHPTRLPPTIRGYKRSILFSPLAGSTAGPYHHPTTHNKRV